MKNLQNKTKFSQMYKTLKMGKNINTFEDFVGKARETMEASG